MEKLHNKIQKALNQAVKLREYEAAITLRDLRNKVSRDINKKWAEEILTKTDKG